MLTFDRKYADCSTVSGISQFRNDAKCKEQSWRLCTLQRKTAFINHLFYKDQRSFDKALIQP
jgi:hypothetical protein